MNIRSTASVTLSILCRCGRPLGHAEVCGEQVEYLFRLREGQRPLATRVDVGPSFRLAGSMADVTASLTAWREWEQTAGKRWTVVVAKHSRCRLTPQIREERLNALALAAVGAGKTSITLG
jgi:hypothetical protein